MWTFEAMSTEVAVAAPDLSAAAERELAEEVAALFAATERAFSRFRVDSELARLNRATAPFPVSEELWALLLEARRHVAATDGLFDPAVGGALCAAGYDRSFAPGELDRAAPPATAPRARLADLELDAHARSVRRPPHVTLDFGGFLKGRTVDRAAALAPGLVMIDAGGDAALRGAGPAGQGWCVEVEDPSDPRRVLATLRVRDAAVATSAPNRRTWRAGDARAHHLIDPRTGAPARSDLAQVTVVAPRAEDAEVAAKVVFVRGLDDGARWLAGRAGLGGVLVTRRGEVIAIGELELAAAPDVAFAGFSRGRTARGSRPDA